MNKIDSNIIIDGIHELLCFVPKPLSMVQELHQNKFVEFPRNICNNTPKNASALYTPTDAVQGGKHTMNSKPSKECTCGAIKSGCNDVYRHDYIVVLVM